MTTITAISTRILDTFLASLDEDTFINIWQGLDFSVVTVSDSEITNATIDYAYSIFAVLNESEGE